MLTRNYAKIFLGTLILLLLISLGASQELSSVDNSGVVWLNSETSFPEVDAKCSSGSQESKIDKITLEGESNPVYEGNREGVVLNTSDFIEAIETIDNIGGEKTLKLLCQDGAEKSITVKFARLENVEFSGLGKPATGFVGELMKDESGSLGNRGGLKLKYDFSSNVQDIYDLSAGWDISMGSGMTFEDDSAGIEAYNEDLALYPYVNSYPEGLESSVNITRAGEFSSDYSLTNKNFFIHEWRAVKAGNSNPGRDITYEQVSEGEYEFYLDMQYRDRDGLPATDLLESEDFRLTVKERGKDGDYNEYPNEDESYDGMKIMKQEDPGSNSNANYRVSIDEYSKLDKLSSGRYKFILEVVYDTKEAANSPEKFKVDETRVDKTSEFSGVVLNSGGSGVVSKMILRDEQKDTKQNLVTDDTGRYSTEIKSSSNSFNVNAEFYETSGDTGTIPDGEVTLSGVELENSDLGPGGSAVKFDYLGSPEVDIEGLNPVNMMMVKFGYPTGDVEELNMAFDSGKVDPQDMKVFECDAWNFEGRECMTNWGSALSEEDVTVNPATWTVNLKDTNLYSIEDDKILMNAYVIGSNSRIGLQDSIDVPDLSIKKGESLEASGVLIDEGGDRVEDANVTLSLIGTGKEWNAETDSTGTFEFNEELNVERGNYQLRLEAFKPPYKSFEKESDKTINVYYGRGLSVSSESDPVIPPGEEYDIEYTLENTGQTSIEDIEFEITGVQRNRYQLSSTIIQSLEAGDTATAILTLDPPEEFQSPPAIEFSATGQAEGEEVSNSATTLVSFDQGMGEQKETNQTESADTEDSENNSAGSSVAQQVRNSTGEFIESQSDMNLALGLILVFAAILAVAVKDKKNQSVDRRGGGRDGRGRGRMNAPTVAPKKVKPSEEKSKEDKSEEKKEASEKNEETSQESEKSNEISEESGDDESGSAKCDVCGEAFDTESGVKLHKQALH